jgi:ribosome-interacting GTPase 1
LIVPTNLPPEYHEADKRYRAAQTHAEKITALEALISTIPKHKGTDHLRAGLRQRLSKLKSAVQTKKSVSRHESAYHIDPEGAGQVVVIGPPNVGKSALVAALTNASPAVADFPHTTWKPTPGMMPVENIQIQLIDTPPLSREFVEPDFLDLIRRVDQILIVVDLQTDPVQQLEDTIALLAEHRIIPYHPQERYPDDHRLTIIPCLVVANKNDDEQSDENVEIFCELLEEDWPLLPLSVTTGRNLELLKTRLLADLEIIRVYTKAPNKKPDFTSPFVLKQGDTVMDLAERIHHDFVDQLKSARIWGQVDFDGQLVSRDHVLHDGDVVELHI